jgi:hypothetical protein
VCIKKKKGNKKKDYAQSCSKDLHDAEIAGLANLSLFNTDKMSSVFHTFFS